MFFEMTKKKVGRKIVSRQGFFSFFYIGFCYCMNISTIKKITESLECLS